MTDFKLDCNVCGVEDDDVWEVVHGIALCESHQEEWFASKQIVNKWVDDQLLNRAIKAFSGTDDLEEIN